MHYSVLYPGYAVLLVKTLQQAGDIRNARLLSGMSTAGCRRIKTVRHEVESGKRACINANLLTTYHDYLRVQGRRKKEKERE